MNRWNVVLSQDSQAEIRSIYSYIANTLFVPATATEQVRKIIETIESLQQMPLRFSLYESEPWRSQGLRKVPIGNYAILYWVNEKSQEVVIYHVCYGMRNLDNILNEVF